MCKCICCGTSITYLWDHGEINSPLPPFFLSNNVIYSKCMKKNQEYIAPVLNSICQSLLHDSLFLFPKFVIFHNHFHTSVYKKCFSYAVFHLKYWN